MTMTMTMTTLDHTEMNDVTGGFTCWGIDLHLGSHDICWGVSY